MSENISKIFNLSKCPQAYYWSMWYQLPLCQFWDLLPFLAQLYWKLSLIRRTDWVTVEVDLYTTCHIYAIPVFVWTLITTSMLASSMIPQFNLSEFMLIQLQWMLSKFPPGDPKPLVTSQSSQKVSIQITLYQRLQKRKKEETTTKFAF